MQNIGKRLTALLLALCLCAALTGCGSRDVVIGQSEEEIAEPTPEATRYLDFTGTLLGGGEYTLSDQEGKVILLNFWATWCGPCVAEMPAFPRLIEKYGDDLALVAVDLQEDEQTVADFAAKNGYDFPIVLDTDGAIGKLYPTTGIPYTLIIAPDGTIAGHSLGADTANAMFDRYCAAIDKALGK